MFCCEGSDWKCFLPACIGLKIYVTFRILEVKFGNGSFFLILLNVVIVLHIVLISYTLLIFINYVEHLFIVITKRYFFFFSSQRGGSGGFGSGGSFGGGGKCQDQITMYMLYYYNLSPLIIIHMATI